MRILCANVGSTSFKYQIIDIETTTSLVKGGVDRIGDSPSAFTHAVPGRPTVEGEIDAPTHTDAIAHAIRLIIDPEVGCLTDLEQLDGVGFKTILAKGYWRSARITEDVIAALEASTPLAPMHNPAYIASIRAFQELLPTTPLVAVFETWFHQTMPDYAAEFGVPRFWGRATRHSPIWLPRCLTSIYFGTCAATPNQRYECLRAFPETRINRRASHYLLPPRRKLFSLCYQRRKVC